MKRIAIIGNAGGGKSTLARALGQSLNIPVYHVDSIQFQENWQYTPNEECDRILNEIASSDTWIIDGFGSTDAIEKRLHAADTIVFVDFPVYLHYWWAIKRQLSSRRQPRTELPAGCPEFSLSYTWRLFKVMWEVHKVDVPWFKKVLSKLPRSTTLHHICSAKELAEFVAQYRSEPGAS